MSVHLCPSNPCPMCNEIVTCKCGHTNLDHTEDGCEICGCGGFSRLKGYTAKEFTPEVKRGKMVGREVKLATCENCNNSTVTSDGICFQCGHSNNL